MRKAPHVALAVVALLAPMVLFSTPAAATPAQEEEGIRWKGVIAGQLEFFVTFVPGEGGEGYTATVDIPMQGLQAGELTEVVYTDEEMAFTLPIAPPSGATWKLAREGRTASGTLTQGGQEIPITMEIMEDGEPAGPPRPQTPQPPFPYSEHEVTYVNSADGTRLAGTLTIPDGGGPHPVALLITGSGAQDRDESLLGHQPFWVIADHLGRNGIAVLRVDDRGVGGSTGSVATSTSNDFAGDVLAGVTFLRERTEIDAGQIGLIGHSEGGIVASMAAARSDDVAFIVLLAGSAMTGRELMPLQLAAVQRSIGRPEDNIERQVEAQEKLLDLVIADADRIEVRQAVADLIEIQRSNFAQDQRPPDEQLGPVIDNQTDQVLTPWYRHFLTFDPRAALRQVTCPVLALNGSLDVQVPAPENLGEIHKALEEAGNEDVTTRQLEGLNHLFQSATTGSPGEYAVIEETFAPVALDLLTAWIRKRAGLERYRPLAGLIAFARIPRGPHPSSPADCLFP